MNKMVNFGIDLGTTNSLITKFEKGNVEVFKNPNGFKETLPSIVGYRNDAILVGEKARTYAERDPKSVISRFKRKMGTTETMKIASLNASKSPIELSAEVLKELKNFIHSGEKPEAVVITIPASFDTIQSNATKEAGELAGFKSVVLLQEPIAASLAYANKEKNIDLRNSQWIVYDFGGGTFDVALVKIVEGELTVIDHEGDNYLGGTDFDAKIVEELIAPALLKLGTFDDLVNQMKSESGKYNRLWTTLLHKAEEAKIELSTVEKTTIHLPFITADKSGPKHIEKELTREVFENLCKNLINRCRIPVEKALKDAKLDKSSIDEIVLVGGSTRIPAIQQLVESLTGKKPNKSVNPDEVVAIGAAIQAGILAGEITDILLLDVTPLSLGVETVGGIMTKLIARNTTIPVKKSELFSTASNNQTNVEIHVLQGEREMVSGNKSLGTFKLEGIPEAPKGTPQIEVTFDINVDGILSVTAKENESGKQQNITIQGASTLSEAEVNSMLEEAEKSAAIDKQQKLIATAEMFSADLDEAVKQDVENIKWTPEEKERIRELQNNMRQAKEDKNFESMQECFDLLVKLGNK